MSAAEENSVPEVKFNTGTNRGSLPGRAYRLRADGDVSVVG